MDSLRIIVKNYYKDTIIVNTPKQEVTNVYNYPSYHYEFFALLFLILLFIIIFALKKISINITTTSPVYTNYGYMPADNKETPNKREIVIPKTEVPIEEVEIYVNNTKDYMNRIKVGEANLFNEKLEE